jgi:predicted Rossmann fold flavoprotein
LATEEPLQNIDQFNDGFLLTTAQRTIFAKKVLLATGGKSYPACGTTGDGYRWAAELGHTIVPPRTALVPVTTHAAWVTALQGITIADVLVKVIEPLSKETGQPHCLANQRGSFLFTHFGLSGPAVLDISRVVSGYLISQQLILQCDFLPCIKQDELDAMIAAECVSAGQKLVAVVLDRWLPRRLVDALLDLAKVPSQRRSAELSKTERRRLVQTIKQSPIPVAGTMGFRKAEVTAGGVKLDEVDSSSMQSKIIRGLYFAGELLDIDGPIGGYNFQAAFSTGYLAGESM